MDKMETSIKVRNRIRRTAEDRAISVIVTLMMLFVFAVTVYPFWYSIVLSFNEGTDALRGGIYLWPRKITLDNYNAVLGIEYIPNAFLVSVGRTLLGTVCCVLFTGLFAYACSHKKLMFRKFYITLMIITMYFSGGLIPKYVLFEHDLHRDDAASGRHDHLCDSGSRGISLPPKILCKRSYDRFRERMNHIPVDPAHKTTG